jgi:GxxExxY protein
VQHGLLSKILGDVAEFEERHDVVASRKVRKVRKGSDCEGRACGRIPAGMTENEIAKVALDAAFKIHTKLGPGLLESVYETILSYELRRSGLKVQRQFAIPIRYENLEFEEGFRADLLVNDILIIELKSVESLAAVHAKQVLTQLRLSRRRLGLLINFGEVHLKNGIKRIAHDLPDQP